MKPLVWVGSSKRSLLTTARAQVLHAAGRELERVQRGGDPIDWKPMTSIGRGAREIRVHVQGELRVFYVAAFPEAIYVLHVFDKKTQKTPAHDLTLGKERYRSMMEERRKL